MQNYDFLYILHNVGIFIRKIKNLEPKFIIQSFQIG